MTHRSRLCKNVALLSLLLISLALPACSKNMDKKTPANQTASERAETETSGALRADQSPASALPSSPPKRASIRVLAGAQLERDILPLLSEAFALEKNELEETLAALPACEEFSPEAEGLKRLEGVVLAGVYPVYEGQSVGEWLELRRFETLKLLRQTEAELATQGQSNTLNLRERLILASIVQAECLADTGYDEVSAVFLNRLEAGEALQSCVTAEYQVGYQRPYLLYKEMDDEGPYNTYLHVGLPPGAIASPTSAAIKAASRQSANPDLYFFFYDYLDKRLRSYVYADYARFSEEGGRAYERFEAQGPCPPEAVVNKQALFGATP